MNVIADAGATKTDWVVTTSSYDPLRRITRRGLNVMQLSDDDLEEEFSALNKEINPDNEEIENVFFYGAGCTNGEVSQHVTKIIEKSIKPRYAEAGSDMLGAARALFGNREGIACIIGTGSNSCLYDGENIIANIPPLGYLLGDEGSGVSLGRRLIADIYRGILPSYLKQHFEENTSLNLSKIYSGVYRSSNPRELLASVVPYLAEYQNQIPEYTSLISDEFRRFITRNVLLYPNANNKKLGFVGGVAYAFSHILTQICVELGLTVGSLYRRPIDNLLKYHSQIQ